MPLPLGQYREAFARHRQLWEKVGFDPDEGLQGRFRDQVHALGPLLTSFAGIALERADGAQRSAARSTVALIAAAVVGGVIILGYLGRRIARPIHQLTEASRRIRRGDVGRVEVRTGDEFEELAEAFNAMTRQLLDSQQLLEARVTERTRDLIAARDQLQQTNGKLESALAHWRDAAARAEHLAHEASAASQAKSEFLATVSHKLRTPINGILGFLTILAESPLTSEQSEQVDTVKSCSEHLLGLVNQILDVARVEQGKLEVSSTDVDLVPIVREIVSLLDSQARSKGLVLLAPRLDRPIRVRGDGARIRQVLLNLVNKTIKFTDRGQVSVSWHESPAADGAILRGCLVEDTGIGISPDKLPGLFEKFVQADGSAARRHGGLGLGLAICRGLMEAMDGSVGADSVPGRGSRFWFVLPAAGPVAEAPRPSETAGSQVILATHDLVNGQMATVVLRRLGITALRVSEPAELRSDLRPRAIILDAALPGWDRAQLDSRFPGVALYLLTENGALPPGWTDRVAGQFTKPLQPAQLRQAFSS